MRLFVLALACAVPPALIVLFSFSPEEFDIYPKCMFHLLTGLHCPGCGATRACFALLHGQWDQAIAFNAYFVLSLPWLTWTGARIAASLMFDVPFRQGRLGTALWIAWAIGFAVFGILRNIDVGPLALLAPHKL
jgi:hypothetical protein